MSPSPNTSGNAGSSGNPLSLASAAATVLHPYRQNVVRFLLQMRTYAVSPTRSRRRQDAPPGHFWRGAGPSTGGRPSGQQFRQLGEVHRHAPGLVAGQPVGRRAAPRCTEMSANG